MSSVPDETEDEKIRRLYTEYKLKKIYPQELNLKNIHSKALFLEKKPEHPRKLKKILPKLQGKQRCQVCHTNPKNHTKKCDLYCENFNNCFHLPCRIF